MKKKTIYLLIVVFALVTSNFASSQIDTNKTKRNKKLKEAVIKKLVEDAEFTKEEAEKYLELTFENRKEIRKLTEDRNNLFGEIENNTGAADIGTKLDDLIELEKKIANIKITYFDSLKAFLTPEKIAKSLILQKKLRKLFFDKLKR